MKTRTLTLLPLIALAASAHATDWPQYHGPLGDSSTPDPISWPSSGPKPIWKVESPNGFSSFSVAVGRCFTIEGREADGAPQEVLIARTVADGRELWTAVLGVMNYGNDGGNSGASDNKGGDGPRSTPTVAGKVVIAMNADLVLRGFDAAAGKELWKIDLIADHGGKNIQWKNAASPLLFDGLVYVGGGGAGQAILAIDPADGKIAAKGFDEKMTHATPAAGKVADKPQIVFFLQSGLLAVEPKTLKELWRYAFPYKTSTAASPVIADNIVYCSAGYGVGAGAVKVTNAAGKWSVEELYRARGDDPLANHWSTPVFYKGHLYGMFQFKKYGNGPMKCVDVTTGKVKWEQEGFGPGNVVRSDDKILALSDAGELVLVAADPGAYKELGRTKVIEGKCWTTPVLSNGRVFVRSTKEAACCDVSGGVAAR